MGLEAYLSLHFKSSPGSAKLTSISLLSSTDFESEHLSLLWPALARKEVQDVFFFPLSFY